MFSSVTKNGYQCLLAKACPSTFNQFLVNNPIIYPPEKKVFRGYENIKWKHWPEMGLIFRNSRPDGFCKGGVAKSLAKSARKHLCQILFSNKVAGLIKNTFTEHLRATVCTLILYVFYSNLPVNSFFYHLI